MSVWHTCQGMNFCQSFSIEPWRVVEAQHISSSRNLVETREEHDVLEQLLERSKPTADSNVHYLIFTPFRYPPLAYGSRFGNAFEPSLWYGSLDLKTAFSEVAFYRLKFFQDTKANLEYIEIPMTAFKVFIQTKKGIDLTKPPFKAYERSISHKASYAFSQQLGTDMREAEIEAVLFNSARDTKKGMNVAVFSIKVFKTKHQQYVNNLQNWRCIASKEVIEFNKDDLLAKQQLTFNKTQFETD